MNIFLGLLGIALSWLIIRNREAIGNTVGETEWMTHIGGIYYIVIFGAIFLFLISVLAIFDLTDEFFMPILRIFTFQSTVEEVPSPFE